MKRFMFLSLIFALALALAACAPRAEQPATDAAPVLKVTDGATEKIYTAADLQALGAAEATLNGVTYIGVPLTVLLQNAGIDTAGLTAVKAVASDGFTANYDASLYSRENTLLAYATTAGAMGADEAPFRMVLPGEGGKLNPRQVIEIVAIP